MPLQTALLASQAPTGCLFSGNSHLIVLVKDGKSVPGKPGFQHQSLVKPPGIHPAKMALTSCWGLVCGSPFSSWNNTYTMPFSQGGLAVLQNLWKEENGPVKFYWDFPRTFLLPFLETCFTVPFYASVTVQYRCTFTRIYIFRQGLMWTKLVWIPWAWLWTPDSPVCISKLLVLQAVPAHSTLPVHFLSAAYLAT